MPFRYLRFLCSLRRINSSLSLSHLIRVFPFSRLSQFWDVPELDRDERQLVPTSLPACRLFLCLCVSVVKIPRFSPLSFPTSTRQLSLGRFGIRWGRTAARPYLACRLALCLCISVPLYLRISVSLWFKSSVACLIGLGRFFSAFGKPLTEKY